MSNNIQPSSWEHEFLKEIVKLVRAEFYRAGNSNDSDKLIEQLLGGEENLETDSNDG